MYESRLTKMLRHDLQRCYRRGSGRATLLLTHMDIRLASLKTTLCALCCAAFHAYYSFYSLLFVPSSWLSPQEADEFILLLILREQPVRDKPEKGPPTCAPFSWALRLPTVHVPQREADSLHASVGVAMGERPKTRGYQLVP